MTTEYKLVPVEPTETMVINGFESEPDEFFTDEEAWEQYQEMSGCQQAAHRAKLCWAAMLAAAPVPPQADAQPVAYAVFADNGNIRIWSRDCEAVGIKVMQEEGKQAVPLYTRPDAGEVEKQRQLKMILAERVENAEDNCSVYRQQVTEQQALLQLALTMINRGIVSFDDQIEYRQKLAALSTTRPEADHE
ncbi:hypothetical protein [Pseudomonas fluorescens]|uniref:hypothetical protein n=1 Tax=Pseudomonas fluorescens TaxID=294 RepID=UPI001BE8365A|nr:hypothetical protein [Pseudomonas fluorescens]MBT2371960.1 hypothetical protein [Pseudomonas fluorescens]